MAGRHRQQPQRGAALLVFLVLLVMGALTYIVNNQTSNSYVLLTNQKTADSLALAKAAVIAHALLQNNPGRLVCPEDISLISSANEGQALPSCSNTSPTIGRLPWRSLGMGDLRDGNNDRLWYIYSPGYQNSPINSGVAAGLTLNGKPVVAIVLSPGAVRSGQVRGLGVPGSGDYVEGENSNGDFAFVSFVNDPNGNDRALGISKDELFRALAGRVVAEIRGVDASNGLRRYHSVNGVLPWAAAVPGGSQIPGLASGSIPENDLLFPGSAFLLPPPPVSNRNDWLKLVSYERVSANRARLSIPTAGGKWYEFSF